MDGSAHTLLAEFISRIRADPRIGTTHIALYTALYHLWTTQGCTGPVVVFSYTVMPLAKISSLNTYHRVIRELDRYGYLKYAPSLNRKGSSVFLIEE